METTHLPWKHCQQRVELFKKRGSGYAWGQDVRGKSWWQVAEWNDVPFFLVNSSTHHIAQTPQTDVLYNRHLRLDLVKAKSLSTLSLSPAGLGHKPDHPTSPPMHLSRFICFLQAPTWWNHLLQLPPYLKKWQQPCCQQHDNCLHHFHPDPLCHLCHTLLKRREIKRDKRQDTPTAAIWLCEWAFCVFVFLFTRHLVPAPAEQWCCDSQSERWGVCVCWTG